MEQAVAAASDAFISDDKRKIILEGFSYTFRNFCKSTSKCHLKCTKYQSLSCPAAIVHHRDSNIIDLPKVPHKHPTDSSDVNIQNDFLLRKYIKQFAADETSHDQAAVIINALISKNFHSEEEKVFLVTKISDYNQVLTRQRTNQKLRRALAVIHQNQINRNNGADNVLVFDNRIRNSNLKVNQENGSSLQNQQMNMNPSIQQARNQQQTSNPSVNQKSPVCQQSVGNSNVQQRQKIIQIQKPGPGNIQHKQIILVDREIYHPRPFIPAKSMQDEKQDSSSLQIHQYSNESPKVYPSQQQQNKFPKQKPADFMEYQSQLLPNQSQSKQQFLMQEQIQKQPILLHQNSAQSKRQSHSQPNIPINAQHRSKIAQNSQSQKNQNRKANQQSVFNPNMGHMQLHKLLVKDQQPAQAQVQQHQAVHQIVNQTQMISQQQTYNNQQVETPQRGTQGTPKNVPQSPTQQLSRILYLAENLDNAPSDIFLEEMDVADAISEWKKYYGIDANGENRVCDYMEIDLDDESEKTETNRCEMEDVEFSDDICEAGSKSDPTQAVLENSRKQISDKNDLSFEHALHDHEHSREKEKDEELFDTTVICRCGEIINDLTSNNYDGITPLCNNCLPTAVPKVPLKTTLQKIKQLYENELWSVHIDCVDLEAKNHNKGKRRKMALDVQFKSLQTVDLEIPVLNIIVNSSKKPVSEEITEIVYHLVQSSLAMEINLAFGVCDLANEHMKFMNFVRTGIIWIADSLHALKVVRKVLASGKSIYLNGKRFSLCGNLRDLTCEMTISGNVVGAAKELMVFFNKSGYVCKNLMNTEDENFKVQQNFMDASYSLLEITTSNRYLDEKDLVALQSASDIFAGLRLERKNQQDCDVQIRCMPSSIKSIAEENKPVIGSSFSNFALEERLENISSFYETQLCANVSRTSYSDIPTATTIGETIMTLREIQQLQISNETLDQGEEEAEDGYLCCGEIHEGADSYMRHLITHKLDYTCDICGLKSKYKKNILKHIQHVHQNGNVLQRRSNQKCPKEGCLEIFQYKWELDNHLISRHEEKFTCHLCNKIFDCSRRHARHIRMYHNNVNCPKCGKVLKKGSLRKHLDMRHSNRYNNIRPFKCEICRKAFKYHPSLNNHIKVKHLLEEASKSD